MPVVTTRIIQESPHRYMPWISGDEEKRKLRCALASKDRGLNHQKEKNRNLEEEIRRLRNEQEKDQTRIRDLESELENITKQRDRYRGMLFKSNSQGEQASNNSEDSIESIKKRIRGAQAGHKHNGYKQKPVFQKKRVYLTHCPDCETNLNRVKGVYIHQVEDIPNPKIIKAQVTEYQIEKQWCPICKSIKKAQPSEVIPCSRYGIYTLLYILIQRYSAKSSLAAISSSLELIFGIQISKGTIQAMLNRTKKWLGPEYDKLLTQVRGAHIKHADETGWRIEGVNHWIWGFFTKKAAYYRIEESRGKGVPAKVLENSHETDLLIRDDYRAYKSLDLQQQSCWAHLLRKSREAAKHEKASDEVKILHQQLKAIFNELKRISKEPYQLTKRKRYFKSIEKQIKQIIKTKYSYVDTKDIQTRITNQGTNLITALLIDGAPLTNNLAERQLRPLVVMRKMSGGSKTLEAAQIHMTIMSVIESLKLNGLPIIPNLKYHILANATAVS